MSNLGFKNTLLLTVSLIVVLSVGSSSYFSYSESRDQLTNTIYLNTQERIDLEAKRLEMFINEKAKVVEKVAQDYRENQYKDDHGQRMKVAALGAGIYALVIGFENGDAYSSLKKKGWQSHQYPSSYDPRKRGWYKSAQQSSATIYTDPYTGASSGLLMVSIAKTFQEGVVLGDITLDVLSQTVSSIDMKGAIAMIITEDDTVLASSSEVVKTGEKLSDYPELRQLSQKVKGQQESTIAYQLNGADKVMFSHKVRYGDKNWYLLVGLDKAVVFSQLETLKNKALILTVIYVLVSILITLYVLTLLYRPILALKKTIISLSNGSGDLTQRLEVNSSDDLGQMADGVNRFIEYIQELLISINKASTELNNNVSALKVKSDENANMLDAHVQETELIVTAIEEMSATANTVAQNASDAAKSTQEADHIGKNSLNVVNNAQSKVTELVNDVERTSISLQAMSEETKSINSILEVIGGIAEQTNLLALNAAIEAARAGEFGRGFAVVADEVRALASRTQTSTLEIEQALSSLATGNDKVVDAMEGTKSNCDEAFHSTDKVSESINELSTHVLGITDLTMQIATAAEQQSSVTLEISRNMSALNDIVNQLNANGEESLNQTNNISNVSNKLSSIVQKFKLEK